MKKIANSERGIAHLLLLLVIIVVVGVVGVVGWTVSKKSKATPSTGDTANATTKSNVNATCIASYHDANLCHFAANSTSLDKISYTANLTLTDPQGSASTMTLKSDGKGNNSLDGTGNGQTISSVQFDGVTYVKAGDTGWIKYPAGTPATSAPANPTSDMNIGVGTAGITFKFLDKEPCGKLNCFKYEVSDSALTTSTQYVWFDDSSYQLREWKSTNSTTGTTDMTLAYQAVIITAPSPVQDFPGTN